MDNKQSKNRHNDKYTSSPFRFEGRERQCGRQESQSILQGSSTVTSFIPSFFNARMAWTPSGIGVRDSDLASPRAGWVDRCGSGGVSVNTKNSGGRKSTGCGMTEVKGSSYSTHLDAHNAVLGEMRIVDTTCRDGEQMPGISFTME